MNNRSFVENELTRMLDDRCLECQLTKFREVNRTKFAIYIQHLEKIKDFGNYNQEVKNSLEDIIALLEELDL